jgi:hypothetical protein
MCVALHCDLSTHLRECVLVPRLTDVGSTIVEDNVGLEVLELLLEQLPALVCRDVGLDRCRSRNGFDWDLDE